MLGAIRRNTGRQAELLRIKILQVNLPERFSLFVMQRHHLTAVIVACLLILALIVALPLARALLFVLPIVLAVAAIMSCLTSKKETNTKLLWIIIIILAPLLGPLLWFLWGRRQTT